MIAGIFLFHIVWELVPDLNSGPEAKQSGLPQLLRQMFGQYIKEARAISAALFRNCHCPSQVSFAVGTA
jgi:hypothetical protein